MHLTVGASGGGRDLRSPGVFVAPLVQAKILWDLCRENLDWYDPLLTKLFSIGLNWSNEVAMLQEIRILRFLASGGEGPYQNSDLHIFQTQLR